MGVCKCVSSEALGAGSPCLVMVMWLHGSASPCAAEKGSPYPVHEPQCVQGGALAEIFSLSAKVWWDVHSRILLGLEDHQESECPKLGIWAGCHGCAMGSHEKYWLLLHSFLTSIPSSWINGTHKKKVGFSTRISHGM